MRVAWPSTRAVGKQESHDSPGLGLVCERLWVPCCASRVAGRNGWLAEADHHASSAPRRVPLTRPPISSPHLPSQLHQVDLYENGTIAIVEAVSPELGNRVQRVRVQLPGTSAELLNKFREKKIDFAAHSNTEDGGAVFLNLLGARTRGGGELGLCCGRGGAAAARAWSRCFRGVSVRQHGRGTRSP